MSGGRFIAALAGPVDIKGLGRRPVIPDHKLYFIFIPFDEERPASFIAGLLNAPVAADAIGAYASQLSLGVSVAEYVDLPDYDPANKDHVAVSEIAIAATHRGDATRDELTELNTLAHRIFGALPQDSASNS